MYYLSRRSLKIKKPGFLKKPGFWFSSKDAARRSLSSTYTVFQHADLR
ncbi:MAG: hypothetical protein F6K35_21815 [Okeania sp. SIO2H7]|nr:hypothetical protein [Okeania sp. SIO2H7]